MRKESKSVWLRRIGPLGVAGLLVWPLAGNAADTPAVGSESERADLYAAEHQSRSADAAKIEEARLKALNLGKTAQEKLTIQQALDLAKAGKPEEAIELFWTQNKSREALEEFKKLVIIYSTGQETPAAKSPSVVDNVPGVDAGLVNEAFSKRQDVAALLAQQQSAVHDMVAQGRFKEAEDELQKILAQLITDKAELAKIKEMIDQCEFGKAQKSVPELHSVKGEWSSAKLGEVLKDYQQLYQAWSVALMKTAQEKAQAGEYEEAIARAQRAQKLDVNRTYIKNFVEECQDCLKSSNFRKETSLDAVDPDYRQTQKEISHTMREAKIFFRNKQYEAATVRLERVLLIDPFNLEAIDILSECYERLFEAGRQRTITSAGRAEALNIWEWAEPLDRVQVDATTDKAATLHSPEKADIYSKLEQVIFPSISLQKQSLVTIIAYLNEKSRLYDPEQVGVTIIDNLSSTDKQRELSLEFGKISLLDLIRYISLETGYSYSITNNKVVFGNVDTMSTEYFPVRGDIIAEIIDSQLVKQTESGMQGVSGEGGGSKGGGSKSSLGGSLGNIAGGEDDAEAMGANGKGKGKGKGVQLGEHEAGAAAMEVGKTKQAEAVAEANRNSAALKAYFSERWITFDDGANIIYSPRGERLVVKNTPENLRRMATLLKQLDALDQPMILVEAKLIELADTNLNELGFDWVFSAESEDGKWSIGTSDPNRHGTEESQYQLLNNLKIFPNFGEKIFGSDVNVDLSLSINAVSQNTRAEVLSSPRILTQSGMPTPAKIQMTEKTYFVTEWEQPDVESNGFSISMDISAPDWDEERDLGVIFTVRPTVESDNYTITLEDIHPIFLEHTNDEDYIVTYETGTIIDGVQVPTKQFTYNMKMPEFANREIISSITLYDGETVLLGGMADNESVARSDKWPLLGDIPFFGKFFTDQQTDVSNHSLLIFITARLVDSKGMPLRSSRDRGVVDFKR